MAKAVKQYECLRISADIRTGADKIVFIKPDGSKEERRTYFHVPAKLVYDDHGYEHIETDGQGVLRAAYTPDIPGEYRFAFYCGRKKTEEGAFVCKADKSAHGYVTVSKKDRRYFAYTDGTAFCPVGINMVYPTPYPKSDGSEFGKLNAFDTMGIRQYERWIEKFAAAGGNFLRIWLGHDYFTPDTEVAGQIRYEQFVKTDAIVALAKKYGIKIKFTLEQFRNIGDTPSMFCKTVRTADGRVCDSATEWLTDSVWQEAWQKKVLAFLNRYGDDPTVMVWELWNEMLCYRSEADTVIEWTRCAAKFIQKHAPKQMVTTSFGSLNPKQGYRWQQAHYLKELDYLQVHRYLDQGESDELRRTNPICNTAEAIETLSNGEKPAILAETGAVNDNHSAEFRYYAEDDRGILFADTVYPAFFAGAAGCGQIWHWDRRYVDAKNLYPMFRPFAELVKNLDLPKEGFRSEDLSNDEVFCRVLIGKTVVLGLIRNKEDSWQNVLRDHKKTNSVAETEIAVKGCRKGKVTVYPIWEEDVPDAAFDKGILKVKNLTKGILFKIIK